MPEKITGWKANRRVRPQREGRTGLYRAMPAMKRNGSHKCPCGATISANKEKCAKCAGVQS